MVERVPAVVLPGSLSGQILLTLHTWAGGAWATRGASIRGGACRCAKTLAENECLSFSLIKSSRKSKDVNSQTGNEENDRTLPYRPYPPVTPLSLRLYILCLYAIGFYSDPDWFDRVGLAGKKQNI